MKIEHLSAVELGRKIATRELSSREVTSHFLQRAELSNASNHAFVRLTQKTALARAEKVDSRLAHGEVLGPLAGVPVGIKDILCSAGELTTCCSRILENFRPPYTATSLQQLLNSGLVPIGNTNMDEFAMGGSTETGVNGASRNPWDLSRTPGGSSGGSAAALAAGMVPLTIGSDTGGSVRQPAAFCGVVGLKPTYGRVSRYGLVAFASSLDQVGPLAHYVEDIAVCMELLAGHDPRDSTSLKIPVPQYSKALGNSLKGLKVGIVREQIDHPALDDSIRSAVLRAQDTLTSLGAELIDVHLPHTEFAVATYYIVAPCEASGNLERYDGVHFGFRKLGNTGASSPLDEMIASSRSAGFGTEVKRRIMLGTFALSTGYYDAYYKKALQVRRLIANDYQQAFEQVDLLLGPVTPTTAFKIGEKVNDPVQMYLEDLFTVGANLAGIPGLSLPTGVSASGLPTAVQLQGPTLGEERLLNVAYQLQQSGLHQPCLAPEVS